MGFGNKERRRSPGLLQLVLLCAVLAVSCAAPHPSSPAAASTSSSPLPLYNGPFYANLTGYTQTDLQPYDFTHGLGKDVAERAVKIAESDVAGLSDQVEVGRIDQADASLDCSGCANVTLIDYIKADTHSVVVDLVTSKVVLDSVQAGVQAAAGEQAAREVYGIALADPKVAEAVGDRFEVQPIVVPFTLEQTPCSKDALSQHRCVYGVIYSSKDVYTSAFVDLTTGDLVNRDREQG